MKIVFAYSKGVFQQHFLLFVFMLLPCLLAGQQTGLPDIGLAVLPQPREVLIKGSDFKLPSQPEIVLDRNASEKDRFAANDLISYLNDAFGMKAVIGKGASGAAIFLKRKGNDKKLGKEGYELLAGEGKLVITGGGEAGLFYGVQTLKQLFQQTAEGIAVKGMQIRDWPDTRQRAAHYDTKHHQDTKAYVKSFIRELAGYKMNMLIWEWEDKFAYPSHPEIGAPGAFTMAEMQELTRYAQQYHVQIVPLVQGLGHVGFILKWPQFAHLREIPASNFEFCPLKDGSYELLEDLWKDAMEATPGSAFIHIGSDETYELGACEQCKKKATEIGKSGLFHLFLGRSARLLQPSGRGVMTWEAPMGWAKSRLGVYHGGQKEEHFNVVPQKGIILTESYNYETEDLTYAKQAKALGHPVYAYDPNPGIEQLFLPYFFVKGKKGKETGALEQSYDFLVSNLGKGVFDGVIRTSWDDSGLPMQAWMLCFATTAAYAWNVSGLSMDEFLQTFYANRYGRQATGMHDLYRLLNEAAYFYMESFERRVWAWGEIGKTHLPDLPRGDALEYDPYWNTEYADRVEEAKIYLAKMDTAIAICDKNLAGDISNRYDVEVFRTLCNLARHTALTYLDLSKLEVAIKNAHQQRFLDYDKAYHHLQEAEGIVKASLARRQAMFTDLCAVWEKTRLPKGMSTPEKQYFFEQERTRHFASRVPGMNYLIYDEEKLGLEQYLQELQAYNQYFRERFPVSR
ncbi:beta-N-acetylhexosaminidase [Chitinophaga sp. XS-30]|uniref:beta-N-acetylhexosaminidase n=1 Tax=Chitinophaga sp. XS-30 TaxID=2604421 RepID=UPI0011DD3F3E|nr:beta-N-acetylhexosaminidase [Chitinophaga sp. XS-30]QEH43383.1 family 20 glycosylhydrolase [Chitinophaga sp. XS-30]